MPLKLDAIALADGPDRAVAAGAASVMMREGSWSLPMDVARSPRAAGAEASTNGHRDIVAMVVP
jgi:hypothetical protein